MHEIGEPPGEFPATAETAGAAPSAGFRRRWERRAPETPPAAARPGSRWKTPLLAAVVVLGVVALAVSTRYLSSAAPQLDLELRGRLAVLPLVNATGDPGQGWIATGLMEMVAETLGRAPGVEVVPTARLLKMIDERALDPADAAVRERVRELALALGADLVVDAAIHRRDSGRNDGPARRADATVLELRLYHKDGAVTRGELTGADPLAAADNLAYSLARGLTVGAEPVRLERVFSRDPFLDQLYAMGTAELRTAGPAAARPYFEIALRHQPNFLHARARLADCERRLGRLAESRDLTLLVLEASQARADRRLRIESLEDLALLAALAGEHEEAHDLYTQAYSVLLNLEDRTGQAAVLDELARLALARGETARAEELFVEILQLRQALGDRLGQAGTLIEIGTLALQNGNVDSARQLFSDTRELGRGMGDLWTEMRAVSSLGEVARRADDLAQAEELWRQAAAFYEQRGDKPRTLLIKRNLATVLLSAQKFAEAEGLLYEVVDLAAELDNKAFEASASLRLTWVLLRSGYPLQARSYLERTLELDSYIPEERLDLQRAIAWFAYEQGNYQLAVDTEREVKRQAGAAWQAWDEDYLRVFEAGLAAGRRLPLPGEEGYEPPGP